MKTEQERTAHGRFVQALQHEHLACLKPGCGGAMNVTDHTPHLGRIKIYEAECKQCHTTGKNYRQRTDHPVVGRRLDHDDGRGASPARTTHMPLRRHPHHLYLHAQPQAQSPLPPLVLLLRQTHRNELAAAGSQEVTGTHVDLLLPERAGPSGGGCGGTARCLMLGGRTRTLGGQRKCSFDARSQGAPQDRPLKMCGVVRLEFVRLVRVRAQYPCAAARLKLGSIFMWHKSIATIHL